MVKTILWAEDDEIAYKTYSTALTEYLSERSVALQLIHASNGNEVFRHLAAINHDRSRSVDLVVVDIEMPEWNGFDTINDLAVQWPHLPKMVISTRTDYGDNPQTLHKLLQAGSIRSFHSPIKDASWKEAVFIALTSREGTILHISDIHFGETHAFSDRLSLLDLTRLFLDDLAPARRPNLIVMSGDLTNRAQNAEFTRGFEYLAAVLQMLGLGRDRLVIVPGNHDVFRGEERNARLDKFASALNLFYGQTPEGTTVLRAYPLLAQNSSPSLRASLGLEDRLFSIRVYDDVRLVIITMNSSIVDSDRYDWGEVSEAQLIRVKQQISGLRKPQVDYPRIAVFHHHLFPVPSFRHDGAPERVLRRQALVLRFLIGMHVQLVLHGHTHYTAGYKYLPYFIDGENAQTKPIFVLGTGTMASTEREGSQAWFHLSLLSMRNGLAGEISQVVAQPFSLRDDSVKWNSHAPFTFDLTASE